MSDPSAIFELLRIEGMDKANAERARRNRVKREAVSGRLIETRDRRRFKEGPIPTGEASRTVPETTHSTIFPSSIQRAVPGSEPLVDGWSNSKIGGGVLVGKWKGAHLRTLSLVERETCPKTCPLWTECYGNAMPYSKRWVYDADLLFAIERQVIALTEKYDRLVVRLHVLGDFPDLSYVKFWGRLLKDHPSLCAFGYTAHGPETPIGKRIAALRHVFGEGQGSRFAIRHSNTVGPWSTVTIPFPTVEKDIDGFIVCPEQRDAIADPRRGTHCGTCAACWSADVGIAFMKH